MRVADEEQDFQGAWAALGRHVARARARLDAGTWTQERLAEAVGVSLKTINTIEAGRSTGLRERTKAKLEEALSWAMGDVDRILAGGEPSVQNDRRYAPRDEAAYLPRQGDLINLDTDDLLAERRRIDEELERRLRQAVADNPARRGP